MSSGVPPSSERPSSDPRRDAARGAARDALGALRNLQQLLESLRVGPRALSAVIPDVHASMSPLREAFGELCAVSRAKLPNVEAVTALEGFIAPRIDSLEAALAAAQARPLNARARLELEEAVARGARELDAARGLLDLLDDATSRPSVAVDLAELLREAGKRPLAGRQALEVVLRRGPSRELVSNPRVIAALVAMGAALVARATGATPVIALGGAPSGEHELIISKGPAEGEPLTLGAHALIEPAVAVAAVAARAAGLRLDRDASGARFELRWATERG